MNMNAIKQHADRKIKPPEMAVKGLFKGFRYINKIFDEDKANEMQIGLPTDVKHVAHIGSDGPAANTPSWMSDFKPQENENVQVVSRGGDTNKEQIGEGVGLQELLPPPEKSEKSEKSKHHHKKSRRKSEILTQKSSESLSDMAPKPSRRHHKSRHESIDGNDPSIRRRRVIPAATDAEGSYPVSDGGGSHHSKKSSSRHRKLKGEQSMRKNKGKSESSNVDASNISVSDRD